MTKSTISRERVVALIAEHSYDSALVDALEHLLAAIDSEPVAWLWSRDGDDERDVSLTPPDGDDDAADAIECGWTATPLYRHAQQQVVPPMQHWEELCREYPDMSIGDAIIRAAWWNHCRAAMLNGGKS